jgi:hypothetical protein
MSDETAVIGSFILIVGLLVVAGFATSTYRKSIAMSAQALTVAAGQPFELICGIRVAGRNATWPGGRLRVADEGVGFSCLGFATRAAWSDVKIVELVKPMNLIGWGVRFRLQTQRDAIVWLMSRTLSERVVEACEVHHIPIDRKARWVL